MLLQQEATMQNRYSLPIFITLLLLYLAGSLAFVQTRPIDGDEGYYASAARLVSEGQTPYKDFFYPQTPVIPFAYAPAYKVVGSTIVGLRAWSAILGTLSLLFWGLYLRQKFPNNTKTVLAGLLLLALNPYFLVWNLTVKSFALANFLVTLVFWSGEKGRTEKSARYFFVFGLALGVLLGVRLLYGPWIGFMVLMCLLGWKNGQLSLKQMGLMFFGLVIGLLPTAILLAQNFDAFLFNNFHYHALRHAPLKTEIDPLTWAERITSTSMIFARAMFLNPFMLFSLLLAGWGVKTLFKEKGTTMLTIAGGGLVIHMIASLIPYPAHDQYFTAPLAPMMVPLALVGMMALGSKFAQPGIWGLLVVGLILSVADLTVLHSGMDQEKKWSIEHLNLITAEIEKRTEPDDLVLSFWSGYTFESGRQFIPSLENHFAVEISERITLEEKWKYHVASKELLLLLFERQSPNMIVLGTWMNSVNSGLQQGQLALIVEALEANYGVAYEMGETKLLIRKQAK